MPGRLAGNRRTYAPLNGVPSDSISGSFRPPLAGLLSFIRRWRRCIHQAREARGLRRPELLSHLDPPVALRSGQNLPCDGESDFLGRFRTNIQADRTANLVELLLIDP